MASERIAVGVVSGLVRYPLKSAAGEHVSAARLGWHGVQGDRRFAFLRSANKTGFPWLTARQVPELVVWKAWHDYPADMEHSSVLVQPPGCEPVLVSDPSLLERVESLAGEPIHLLNLWSGAFDADDIAIVSSTSADSACAAAGVPLNMARFRANIEVKPLVCADRIEDKWVGRRIVFGERPDSARVRVNRRDKRCVVVDVDPTTGVPARGLFEHIAKMRKNELGVYGRTEGTGSIAVGDTVYLLK